MGFVDFAMLQSIITDKLAEQILRQLVDVYC